MSVSGLCQICENAQARYECANCGRLVCGAHYDEAVGRCMECAREVTPDHHPEGPDRPDADDPEGGDINRV